MNSTFLSLLFFAVPAGSCFGQDPGCWSPPQVLQPLNKAVCYICKLVYKPSFLNISFSLYEPEQTLSFEVVNLCGDPFMPQTIQLKVENGKYPNGFFKEGKTYTVVAEYSRVEHYVSYGPSSYRSCFLPRVSYEDQYKTINISTTE